MNTRLSANAAEPARSEKQAKSAEMDRMSAPADEGLPGQVTSKS
jgi:hypothetical protein